MYKIVIQVLNAPVQVGFRIGYSGPRSTVISPNLRSAQEQPHVIDAAIAH